MTAISPATIERMKACCIVPVITIQDVKHAVPLAKALIAGGVDVLEVTLRTDCALDAIQEMKQAKLDALIGAGTITTEAQVNSAANAGAEFLVTPGTPASLLPALKAFDGAVFPGCSTVSESLALRSAGFSVQKFFPAEPAGGSKFLKALGGPVPDVHFMPTGGISMGNARQYLDLPNVIAVGGSWIVPNELIENGEWDVIALLAKESREELQSD